VKRYLVLVALSLLPSTLAHADAKADVTKAFATFIAAVAANKTPAVELFIAPASDERTDDGAEAARKPVPVDLSETRAIIASSKLETAAVAISKGGRSAWIAGEIAGRVERAGTRTSEPIRVSAFLAKDDSGWHVTATHWSTGERDVPTDMCGMRDDWELVQSVPKDALPIVKMVFDALSADFKVGEGPIYDTSKFGKILSNDKAAYTIGSAPKEVFVGGAKIKRVFRKWQIRNVIGLDSSSYPVKSAIGPDGDMAWIAMGMIAPPGLCVSYRTFMVLAKEPGGWKIVHQHYSETTGM
jgi:ketosteroid isomerase-like protein